MALVGQAGAARAQGQSGGYRLPWPAGKQFRVAQAWGGVGDGYTGGTHFGVQYYAYDFAMPINTPILAANDGVVVFARGDVPPNDVCYSWSCANTVNYVTVADQADNSETVYVHLSSVVVRSGDRVARGQLLGYSGMTGFTRGFAHLHFQRTVLSRSTWYPQSIPVYFDEAGAAELAPGHYYTSQNTSSGPVQPVLPDTRAISTINGSGYWLDGFGDLHPVGNAPAIANTSTDGHSWPGWNIARSVALLANGQSGYVLDGYGGIHPFGGAPPIDSHGTYWPGWDIARQIVLAPGGTSGYLLDGYGGLHPLGSAPGATGAAYWPGWDIARGVALRSDGRSGYTLDGYGGVHPFGGAPAVATTAYWGGWDIARAIALRPDGVSGYVLDGYGAVHPFGGAPDLTVTRYTPSLDDARGLVLSSDGNGGWVLFGDGGVAKFGDAPAPAAATWPAGSPTSTPAPPDKTPILVAHKPAPGTHPGAPAVRTATGMLRAAIAKCKLLHRRTARARCIRAAHRRMRPNYT